MICKTFYNSLHKRNETISQLNYIGSQKLFILPGWFNFASAHMEKFSHAAITEISVAWMARLLHMNTSKFWQRKLGWGEMLAAGLIRGPQLDSCSASCLCKDFGDPVIRVHQWIAASARNRPLSSKYWSSQKWHLKVKDKHTHKKPFYRRYQVTVHGSV